MVYLLEMYEFLTKLIKTRLTVFLLTYNLIYIIVSLIGYPFAFFITLSHFRQVRSTLALWSTIEIESYFDMLTTLYFGIRTLSIFPPSLVANKVKVFSNCGITLFLRSSGSKKNFLESKFLSG